MQNDSFPETPSEWDKGPVSMIADINPRYPVKKGQELPFIEMAAVAEQFGGIQRMEWRKLEGSGLARFKVGDTLFAKITPCPENGKVAFVRELPTPYGIGSTEFIVLSPKANCNPRYLYHLVCAHAVRGRAASRMEGSTGRQRVPDDVFEKRLLVPVPSPEEQAAIARVLDTNDAAIERCEQAIQSAHQLASSLISAEIEKQDAPVHRLNGYISDIRYGTSQASNERNWGCPTLRIPNVIGDKISLDDVTYVDVRPADRDRLALQSGDLLLVRTNGNPNYVGRSAVFASPDQRTWLYASYLIRVRLSRGVLPDYINLVLGTERGRRELLRRVTTSAGNHNINSNSVRLLSIPVPASKKEQEWIVELACTARAKASALITKKIALLRLKSALMADLLSGRTRLISPQPEVAEAV